MTAATTSITTTTNTTFVVMFNWSISPQITPG